MDTLIESLTRRMNTDFPTFNQVNAKTRDLNQSLTMDMMTKSMWKEAKQMYDNRFEALTDLTHNCKTAIQSHTKHITSIKKDVENKAQKRSLEELTK